MKERNKYFNKLIKKEIERWITIAILLSMLIFGATEYLGLIKY